MNQNEKQLFRALCNFKSEDFDAALLKAATPDVLGHLFFNRMQAIAYGTLVNANLLGKVNREFRNSLKDAYEQNLKKNCDFSECLTYLTNVLAACNCPYALLKGAFLCNYYPKGFRTSNDIDLLVCPENVTEIDHVLTQAGFKQGNIRNGNFVPASRQEIIESKMLRGETVPYIKEINRPGMKYLEVDINFSLDYKNGNTDILKNLLSRVWVCRVGDVEIQTLNPLDFFIHLCSHLYKEATTLPWIEMMRDMTMYKYCDIYTLLTAMTEKDVRAVFSRAEELGMSMICAFTILQTAAFFDIPNKCAQQIAKTILLPNPDFVHQVISPKDKKLLVYTEKNVFERFFAKNRKALLKEVKNNEQIENEAK